MASVRRALVWASTSKFLVALVNLSTTAVMARLLTPREFGIAVIGMTVYTIAEAARELGGGAYLIQNQGLTHEHIRTTFTISLVITLTVTALLALFSAWFANFYGTPELADYLKVVALWFVIGPFFYPILALMTRKMSFGHVAAINIVTAITGSVATIILALLGFSFMSYAWASVFSSICGTLLGLYLWRDLSVFRPLFRGWRGVLEFSVYDSATAIFLSIWAGAPFFILARFLGTDAIGIVQRAYFISQYPERIIMSGVGAVSLPAFSEQRRLGRDLKAGYITAIEHITGLQWPALIVLALLAHPIVMTLLGSQWPETVPLTRIMCGALLFYFPIGLNFPLLTALGAIRSLPPLVIVQAAVSLTVLWMVAPYGLEAAACSMFATVPFNVMLSMAWVRFYLPFEWTELVWAMRKSAAAALCSAAGPMAIVALSGWRFDLSIVTAVPAGCLAALGWLAGLWFTDHPLLHELARVVERFARRFAPVRIEKP
jgi:O-antigen/teichoic acid export membrane protein